MESLVETSLEPWFFLHNLEIPADFHFIQVWDCLQGAARFRMKSTRVGKVSNNELGRPALSHQFLGTPACSVAIEHDPCIDGFIC